MIFAGVGEEVITPPVGAPIVGTIAPCTGVHDDLFVRALVLSDGKEKVAIVSLDLCGMDFETADEIRSKIKATTQITTALLCSSHTHSAPFTIPYLVTPFKWLYEEGKVWRDELIKKAVDAVQNAANNPQKASLRVGRAIAQAGINRRHIVNGEFVMTPNPEGSVVPWVDVLRVDNTEGKPIAIFYTHAAHPVIVHGASPLISGDYPAFASETIRKHFGNEVMPLFAQACGADINGEPLRGGFDSAKAAGDKLGEAVVKAANESVPITNTTINTAFKKLQLPLEEFSPVEELEKLVASMEMEQAQNPPGDDPYPNEFYLCFKDRLAKAKQGPPEPLRFELMGIGFGDEFGLIGLTHEVFSAYQLWADANLPFEHNFVTSYTNACESYIPTDQGLDEGGYEGANHGAALMWPRRSRLQKGAEEIIKEAMKGLFK
jgi:hypothetical protein